MAAVLCEGIGKVLCLPCKVCGVASSKICKKEFCLYNTVVLGTGIPPIIMMIQSLLYKGGKCIMHSRSDLWLYVQGVLCGVNILAGMYISDQILGSDYPSSSQQLQQMEQVVSEENTVPSIPMAEAVVVNDEEAQKIKQKPIRSKFEATPTPSAPPLPSDPPVTSLTPVSRSATIADRPHPGSINRVKNVLCYDRWVALYFLLLIIFFGWQFLGVFYAFSLEEVSDCEENTMSKVVPSLICGFIFMFFSGTSFCCSLFCTTAMRNFRSN